MEPSQNPSSAPQPAPPASLPVPEQRGTIQQVQVIRPITPAPLEITPEVQKLSDESKRRYPHLNLSPGEFVIESVQRHPIGLVKIWAFVVTVIVAMLVLAMFFSSLGASEGALITGAGTNILLFAGVMFLSVLFMLGGIVATYVYNSNRFYLTNESVIQEIVQGLFSRHVQTVSLSNIEDASYRQIGILPHLLNYGDIRLSTEGDETTYRFSYVANPDNHIAKLNNAVEAFKNGRPVVHH